LRRLSAARTVNPIVGGAAEVEVVMAAASGIESGAAMRAARVAREIGGNGEGGAAGATEDGGLVKLGWRPRLEGVVGESVVAILAGVEEAAAAHLDGNDVGGLVVVEAARLRVEVEAVDFWGG